MILFDNYKTFICALYIFFPLMSEAQNDFTRTSAELAKIKALQAHVEEHPQDLKAHQAFINSYRIDDPTLEAQYKIWVKQYPKIFAVSFAIGKAYSNHENSKAAPFLHKANQLEPENAEVYTLLANNAIFTNNTTDRQAYLKKAVQYAPFNAVYALNYAFSFENTDTIRYDSLSLDVVKKFPETDCAAQALYWLANHSKSDSQKIAYYKQLYQTKILGKSRWYSSAMTAYFDILLNTKPEQALEFGNTMAKDDKVFADVWQERLKVASQFVEARKFIKQNHGKQAVELLSQVSLDNFTLGHHIDAKEALVLFKAEASDAEGQTLTAFDTISIAYSKKPTERLRKFLISYGSKVGMDSDQVVANIKKLRSKTAKKATNFQLKNYYTSGKSSLADYAGKVVLLTYWFPGCGPCRAEFPHFESVLKKINSTEVAYLGLNIFPSQDVFVLPLLKANGYSFTPLKDEDKRNKGNLPVDAAPTNYLIDQKGRIVFSNFTIDASNERTLELMIKETLSAKDY